MIKYKDRKLIQVIDMTSLSDQSIDEDVKEKLQKYLHLLLAY